jgi:hypothetical protein
MPPTPDTVSQATLDIYDQLGPWRDEDEGLWQLLAVVDAIGSQHAETEAYTRDDATHTGWGQLLDLNVCPSIALPWLGQFVGVQIPDGMDDADARALIAARPAATRGTVGAIRAALQPLLTGTKTVTIRERTPDPYSFKVISYSVETPAGSGPAALAALTAAKPAGLIMSYVVEAGLTWADVGGTWADQVDTWAEMSDEVPS